MWRALVMSTLCPSRAQRLVGNPCQGTGDRTGRATPTWTASLSPSKWPRAMGGHWPATMSRRLIGSLDRHSKVLNSKDFQRSSRCDLVSNWWICVWLIVPMCAYVFKKERERRSGQRKKKRVGEGRSPTGVVPIAEVAFWHPLGN